MNTKMTWNPTRIILAMGLIGILSAVLLAQEYNFAGTWKGESKPPAAPAAGTPGAARGGPGGGFGGAGGGGGVQKITLRVKVKKDKASGNFTVGSTTDDIKDGHIEGNKLTFKTGLSGQPLVENVAVLQGEELTITRTTPGARGGRPTVYVLKRDK